MLLRREAGHYSSNVLYFEERLKARGLLFERFENSNTFIVPKPQEEVCKKYQLATFIDCDGLEKAHIIIFPFHDREIMEELMEDLQ